MIRAFIESRSSRDAVRLPLASRRWVMTILAGLSLCAMASAVADSCINCHPGRDHGLGAAHASIANDCARCHGGDRRSAILPAAHAGLIAYPGLLANAAGTCGTCHPAELAGVAHGIMARGEGLVRRTRATFGEAGSSAGPVDLQHLGHTPADSLLRKECASCHLGQPKTQHALDAVHDRGGGCLA
ncbi:MAG: hypothetical protein JSR54_20500, partial [Proteobacteria bacterium]|nr:hypothetical protein [Pseudomonadota bacterium]